MKYALKILSLCAMVLLWSSPSWALQDMAPVTLQSSATTNATGTVVDVSRYASIGLDIAITNTATVTFQSRSSTGGTYTAMQCVNLETGETVTTATASMQVQCNVAGLSQFKAPISGCSSCTVVVSGKLSTGSGVGLGSGLLTSLLALFTDIWDTVNHALKVTLVTLLSCEDQANNLCMVGSAVTRQTQLVGTGGVPSTASDATTSATTLPAGVITFHGIVTCTGTCVQTQKIYGAFENSATVAKSVLVATLSMNASTTAVDWVRVGPLPFSYYFVVTSGTSGTTPLAGLFAQYN